MIFNDMTSQYFDWLRETVCGRWEPRNLSFHKLLAFLFQQDFIPSCEMDASRAEDGRDLRYRFAQEKSIPYAALNSATSGMSCSMLEMMVGLSIRIEEHIMADSEAGNRVGQWFWSMVVSLGLAAMDDARFNEGRAQFIGKVNDSFPVDREHPPDGLLYTDEIPDGRGIILQYRIQNGEFVYSPQPTTTEDKTEEEEVTYQ